MSRRSDHDWLADMLAEATLLASAIDTVSIAQFRDDPILQRAVQHMLQTIGEAAGKTSDETLAAIPDVPWPQVRGMRNRIVHGYFGIDPKTIWRTAVEEVPALAKAVRAYLDRNA